MSKHVGFVDIADCSHYYGQTYEGIYQPRVMVSTITTYIILL